MRTIKTKLLAVFTAMALLLSVWTPLALTPTVWAAGELFSEDFEDGSADGWNGNVAQWAIVSDDGYRYKGLNSNNETVSVHTTSHSGDTVLAADVKMLAADNANGSFGLIARYTDNNNYYLFYYHKPTSVYRILKKKNGTFSVLASSAASSWDIGAQKRMKVEFEGAAIRLYADDTLQASYTDAEPYTQGRIGFRVNWAEASFDNITVDEYIPPAPEPEQPTLLVDDDFETGTADGWTATPSANWTVVADGGTNRYRGQHASTETIATKGDTAWTNISFEANMKADSLDGANGSAGLIARYTDNNNYYLFYYHKPSTTFRILKKAGGTFTLLMSSAAGFTWNDGAAHTLKVTLYEDQLSFYQDGVLVAETTDSTLTAGKIGMRVNWGNVSFDDIAVDEYAPPPPVPMLIDDDFEAGTAEGWTAAPTGNWTTVVDDTYRYRGQHANSETIAVKGDAAWTDIWLEADVRIGSLDETNGSAGLILRYTDNNNYYLFYYHKATSTFRILKKAGGTFSTLATSESYNWPDGQTYTLKAVAYGNQLSLFRNDSFVLSAEDDTLTTGKVGMRVNWGNVSFDNIKADPAATAPKTGETAKRKVFLYDLAWYTPMGNLNGPNSFLVYNYDRHVVRMLNYPTTPPAKPQGATEPIAINSQAFLDTIKASAKYDLRLMQRMGADVVNYNMGPNKSYAGEEFDSEDINSMPLHGLNQFEQILDAAQELGTGMKLGLFPDIFERNEEDTRGLYPTKDEWVAMLSKSLELYGDHPSMYKVDGKPFVTNFGTQRNKFGLPDSAGPLFNWKEVYDGVKANHDFFWVPDIGAGYTVDPAYVQLWESASDGAHLFSPAAEADFLIWKLGEMEKYFNENVTWMWRPGYYAQGGAAYTEPKFSDMHNLYKAAIDNPSAKWMGLMSWDDLAEDHDIWPSALKGDVLVQFNQYYAQWFKDGVQPQIDGDKVFLMYPDQLGGPNMQANGAPTGKMYYWSVLKQPKTLEVEGFGAISLPAGLHYGEVGVLQRGVHTEPFQAVLKQDGVAVRTMDLIPAIDGTHRWDERLTYRYTSLTEDYKASAGFDMLQGLDKWYFHKWDGSAYSELQYNAAQKAWTASGDSVLSVKEREQRPSETADAVRTWVAPHEGTVRVSGKVAKAAADAGAGDGINAKIALNDAVLFNQDVAAGDTVGVDAELTVQVKRGDQLHFRVGKRGDSVSDRTVWNPTVSYVSNRADTLTAPERVTAMPNDAKVKLGWEDVAGAAEYEVRRSVSGGAYETVAVVQERSYEDFRLTNGTSYSYVIVPVDASGAEGIASAPVQTVPQVVSLRASDSYGANQGRDGWSHYYTSALSPSMEYLTYDKADGSWRVSGDPALRVTATEMQPGDTYNAVRAFGFKRNGTATVSGNVRKLASGGDGVTVDVYRVAGTTKTLLQRIELAAGDMGSHAIAVENTFTTGHLLAFEISKRGATTDYDRIEIDPVVTYMPGNPAAPGTVSVSAETDGVALGWQGVAGAQYYRIKRSESAAGPYITVGYAPHGSGGAIQYTDESAAVGENYYYRVSTVASDGLKWGYGDESAGDSAAVSVYEEPAELSAALSGPAQVQTGQEFELRYSLANIAEHMTEGIYAQQITLGYDADVLEFVGAEALREGLSVVHTNTSVAGEVRIYAVSLGENHPVLADGDLLKLTWRVRQTGASAVTTIETSGVAVSDGIGPEVVVTQLGSHTLSVIHVDKSALLAVISAAQAAHNAAVEGGAVGQYPTGGKAVLQAAIQTAGVTAADAAATQQQVGQAAAVLQAALTAFQQSVRETVDGDLNGDGVVSIGDLGIVARYYGSTSASANWQAIKHADVNGDGVIDLQDLVYVAIRL